MENFIEADKALLRPDSALNEGTHVRRSSASGLPQSSSQQQSTDKPVAQQPSDQPQSVGHSRPRGRSQRPGQQQVDGGVDEGSGDEFRFDPNFFDQTFDNDSDESSEPSRTDKLRVRETPQLSS